MGDKEGFWGSIPRPPPPPPPQDALSHFPPCLAKPSCFPSSPGSACPGSLLQRVTVFGLALPCLPICPGFSPHHGVAWYSCYSSACISSTQVSIFNPLFWANGALSSLASEMAAWPVEHSLKEDIKTILSKWIQLLHKLGEKKPHGNLGWICHLTALVAFWPVPSSHTLPGGYFFTRASHLSQKHFSKPICFLSWMLCIKSTSKHISDGPMFSVRQWWESCMVKGTGRLSWGVDESIYCTVFYEHAIGLFPPEMPLTLPLHSSTGWPSEGPLPADIRRM